MNKKNLPSAEIDLVVPFHDVDSMGIVWHGHYVKYFELARCELLDAIGFGYLEMGRSEYAWPVIETRLKYVAPLRYRQHAKVVATLREWEVRLKIDYVIRDAATSQRLTRGFSVQTAVDRQRNELVMPLPGVFSARVQAYLDELA